MCHQINSDSLQDLWVHPSLNATTAPGIRSFLTFSSCGKLCTWSWKLWVASHFWFCIFLSQSKPGQAMLTSPFRASLIQNCPASILVTLRKESCCQAFCSSLCCFKVIPPQILNTFSHSSTPPDYINLFKWWMALGHWPWAYPDAFWATQE